MNLLNVMSNFFPSRRENDIHLLARYLRILPTADAKKAALIKLLSNLEPNMFTNVDVEFGPDDYWMSILVSRGLAPSPETVQESETPELDP